MTTWTGLTSTEALSRIKEFGFNEIEEKRLSTALENLFKILSDPMGFMLLVLSAIYWTLGENKDAVILLIAYVPIVAVDVVLELRSRKALRSLKQSIKSTCHVIRDGKTASIPTRELVPGDLLILEEGQTLPADGQLIEASNLTIDESSVTGESVPIEKTKADSAISGTTVLTGRGVVELKRTGLNSQIGSIARVLKEFETTPSPVLRLVKRAVRIVFLIALGLGAIVFVAGIYAGETYANSLISSLTLAMAAMPEEFPLVFTLYLSLAAYRLSKNHILVKTLPAVEGLGRVDVICTDKTGTITEGKFKLQRLLGPQGEVSLSSEQINALIFSCEPKAVDAMEAAIFEWIRAKDSETINKLHTSWELKIDYPFDLREKYMSHVWCNRNTDEQMIAMKGSLEGVLSHCDKSFDKAAILSLAESEAESGKRLLGLAAKVGKFSGDRTKDESDLRFIAILSFTDPVRPDVKPAIQWCRDRGIRIKMLTGDHLLTAHAVADKIDLPHEHDQLFIGSDLEHLPDEQRKAAYRRGAIFARLKPEQKLQLVEALKSEGDIVAMTGDGINDAPALKLADIGISMGDRATDVARSTAQLVLLKNDFKGIVNAIIEGERVLHSLGQSFGYLIAFHIPIIGVALFQSFFLNSPLLQPIHIVLLELIVHPVSALVFDERSIGVRRKALITRSQVIWSVVRGGLLTVCTIGFAILGKAETELGVGVLTLVAGNIGLMIAEKGGLSALRTHRSLRTYIAVVVLLLLSLGLAFVPTLSMVFSIVAPPIPVFIGIILFSIFLGSIGNGTS